MLVAGNNKTILALVEWLHDDLLEGSRFSIVTKLRIFFDADLSILDVPLLMWTAGSHHFEMSAVVYLNVTLAGSVACSSSPFAPHVGLSASILGYFNPQALVAGVLQRPVIVARHSFPRHWQFVRLHLERSSV